MKTNDDIPFETTNERPAEALWRVLKARSSRVARQLDEPLPDDDEQILWAEFEDGLVPNESGKRTLVLDVDGQAVSLTRSELMLVGAASAVALKLFRQSAP